MPRRKNKEEMRHDIVQAAMNLLDRKTYQQVTMEEIAKEAQISKRTLYNYFPSKSNLFLTEFKKYFAEFRENIVQHDTDSQLLGEKMRYFLKSVFDFTKNRPAYYKLLLMYQADFFENDLTSEELQDLHEFIRSITTSNRQFFNQYWQHTVNTGLYQDKPNDFLFRMLISVNKLVFLEYYYNRETYADDGTSMEEMIKLFSDMLYISANYDMEKDIYHVRENKKQ